MRMVIRKQTLDSVVVLLVVLVSGNPVVFYLLGKGAILVGVPILLIGYAFVRGFRYNYIDVFIYLLFVLIGLVHFIEFGQSVVPATLGFLLKVAAALLVVRTVRDFPYTYVRVMTGLAILSLAFYVPQLLLGDTLRHYAGSVAIPYAPGTLHVGIHNFGIEIHKYRNSGFFWEPGAFAGYLMLAILIAGTERARNEGVFKIDSRMIVLIVALLTTTSTTGYVALVGFMSAFLFARYGIRDMGRGFAVGAVLAVAVFIGYKSLPFLSEKINAQYEAVLQENERYEITRFGNLIYDLKSIEKRPIFGWSAFPETRTTMDPSVSEIVSRQGNGFTGMVVRFGLVGLLIYLLSTYRYFAVRTNRWIFSASAVLVLCILLMGEQYLNFPLFYTLMFAGKFSPLYAHSKRRRWQHSALQLRRARRVKIE
jgi:hypothetical protein